MYIHYLFFKVSKLGPLLGTGPTREDRRITALNRISAILGARTLLELVFFYWMKYRIGGRTTIFSQARFMWDLTQHRAEEALKVFYYMLIIEKLFVFRIFINYVSFLQFRIPSAMVMGVQGKNM